MNLNFIPKKYRNISIYTAVFAILGVVLILTTSAAPSALPPGVTLQEIDGGQEYFGQWSNSFTTDPSHFPIGLWAEGFQDDQATKDRVDEYEQIGINTFVEPYGWPKSIDTYVANKGMWAVGTNNPTDVAVGATKTTDEPDWRGCWGQIGVHQEMSQDHRNRVAAKDPSGQGRECWTIGDDWGSHPDEGPTSPDFIQAWSDVVREDDPTRPVFNQHTKLGRAGHPVQGVEDWWVDESTARKFAAAADIISNDWYIVPDEWTTNNIKTFVTDDPRYPDGVWVGNVWEEYGSAQRLRSHADYSKPVWMFVSTSNGGGCNYYPTPEDINAIVWNQIIGGARGIEYFNHDFCDQYGTTARALLHSHPYYQSVRAQVTDTNALVTSLATVLNSPFANGYVTVDSGNANVMAKYHEADDSFYVFAAPTQRDSQSVTFSTAEAASVEVVGENRTIPVTNNSFTDSFQDQNTVHIYKVTLEGTTTPTTCQDPNANNTGNPLPCTYDTNFNQADINQDGTVGIVDLSILLNNWDPQGTGHNDQRADINNDNNVGIIDLSIMLNNWGETGGSGGTPPSSGSWPSGWNDPIFANVRPYSVNSYGASGTIEDIEINAPNNGEPLLGCDNFTARRWRGIGREGVRVCGSNVLIEDFFLDISGTGDDHADGIQGYGGGPQRNIVFRRGYIQIDGAMTAGIFFADNTRTSLTLEHIKVDAPSSKPAIKINNYSASDNGVTDISFTDVEVNSGIDFLQTGNPIRVIKWCDVRDTNGNPISPPNPPEQQCS